MRELRSSRRLIKLWHRREKATIDRLVKGLAEPSRDANGRLHSAMTASGLVVEEQLRKAWRPCSVGLATF